MENKEKTTVTSLFCLSEMFVSDCRDFTSMYIFVSPLKAEVGLVVFDCFFSGGGHEGTLRTFNSFIHR